MNAPDPIAPAAGELIPAGEASSPIAEFSATAAALVELAARYHARAYPVETAAGMKAAVAGRRELRELRTAVEARRVELKAPILDRGRLIDTEAKRISAHLSMLEDPIDEQIKAEERRAEERRAERERVERERVAAIAQRIEWIRGRVVEASGWKASAEIDAIIAQVEAVPVTADLYGEQLDQAVAVRDLTLARLRAMADGARAQEAEAARIAQERQRLEAEAAARRAEQEREDRERRERHEAEDRERRERIAREDAERAAAAKAESDRLAAERAEIERREAQERARREAADRAAREEQERQQEAAARAERAEQSRAALARAQQRERLAEAADPWRALREIRAQARCSADATPVASVTPRDVLTLIAQITDAVFTARDVLIAFEANGQCGAGQ